MSLTELLTPTVLLVAGGFVYMVRKNRTDTNRIGKLLRETIAEENKRHNNVNLAILCMVPEDKKKEIAALLREEV